MDKKVQMMDAGTALFSMDGEFGTALGQLRAELKEYGKVTDEDDWMVLNFSTPWRKRFISCHLEAFGDAGKPHRYAAVFKEGSRSTVLRGCVHAVAAAAVLLGVLVANMLFPESASALRSAASFAVCLLIIYAWIIPSGKSVKTLRKIIAEVSALK